MEPYTRYVINYDENRQTIIVHPTKLTKQDVKKLKIYVEVLERLSTN